MSAPDGEDAVALSHLLEGCLISTRHGTQALDANELRSGRQRALEGAMFMALFVVIAWVPTYFNVMTLRILYWRDLIPKYPISC